MRWVTGKANFGFRKETQTLKMMALILIGVYGEGGVSELNIHHPSEAGEAEGYF